MKRRAHVHAEFVGLPAAGKTRLASEVKRQLADRRNASSATGSLTVTTSSEVREHRSFGSVPATAFREVASSPRRAFRSFADIHRTRQPSLRHVLEYHSYLQYVCGEIRRQRAESDVHLADQGYLQHLWRIHLTARRDGIDGLLALTERLYPTIQPDVVVFVEVDTETRMERGALRGDDPDEAFFDPNHPAIVQDRSAYRDVKALVRSISDGPGREVRTVRVHNTEAALAQNTAEITDQLLAVERQR